MKKTSPPVLDRSLLDWFSLDRYPRERLEALGVAGWVQVLADRLSIRDMVKMGRQDVALEAFAELQKDPFGQLGFDRPRVHGALPVDTPTVLPIRTALLVYYADLAKKHGFDNSSAFDFALLGVTQQPAIQLATIQVDLRARRQQIKADFAAWLRGIDKLQPSPDQYDYTADKAFARWIDYKYLPCFDLVLFEELQGRKMSPQVRYDLLKMFEGQDANHPHAPSEMPDALKAPLKCRQAFSWDNVHAMWRQRDAQPEAPTSP